MKSEAMFSYVMYDPVSALMGLSLVEEADKKIANTIYRLKCYERGISRELAENREKKTKAA
jgi:hypothetical protein